jgi:hypothetical protein
MGTRNTRYPYHLWDNGEWHDIQRGHDFHVSVISVRMALHLWAKAHHRKLITRLIDTDTLSIRFMRED